MDAVLFNILRRFKSLKLIFFFRSNEAMQLTIEQELNFVNTISPYYWMPATLTAVIMLIYSLVHAIIITAGFHDTCKQYRNRIVKYTHASGQMVSIFYIKVSRSIEKINFSYIGRSITVTTIVWSSF